jgi:hypothetical protein
MTGITEPRLLYWRIVLVGWGTVVGTGLSIAAVVAIWNREPVLLVIAGLYSLALAAIFCVILVIPMLVIWVPVFSIICRTDFSLRWAATLTTTGVVAIGTLVVTLLFGLLTSDWLEALFFILPCAPIAMGIAACLSWCAFKSERVLGTR